MIKKIQRAFQLVKNMGGRYVFFRTGFELRKRLGLLKKKFPVEPAFQSYYTLDDWRSSAKPFFFESRESIKFEKRFSPELQSNYDRLKEFKYPFFSSLEYELGAKHDWVTNPDNGFKYDKDLHWLDVNDFDRNAGDIKFVWEPSRFSHLYTIIRYDYHSGQDSSEQVFAEIESWLNGNNINQGPNFKCSQEISLRILNWTFALYYYKNSPSLTAERFDKIQHYIFWQTEHVYHNINFSRIAVRNNHAITETLLLYLVGLLYPKYPGAAKWKQKGKAWFEQEIAYQVYEDGTFLQFSMNYHRVVVQLLTWALKLSDLNGERFKNVVYERAKKSLTFLMNCMNAEDGWLPNYGNNDGALFFKLNDAHYRNYMPQLESLSYALNKGWEFTKFEDALWYGLSNEVKADPIEMEKGSISFEQGGYYLYRPTTESLNFIRCGSHKDRPAQADNLHLDIWYGGKNILHDGGTYKYNSDERNLKYFMGTRSHNTVMLGDNDQMEKGSRFIWYHWSQCEQVSTQEADEFFLFEGTIKAFQHLNKGIRHKRTIKIAKNEPRWEVTDVILNKPTALPLNQLWHTSYLHELNFEATLLSGEKVLAQIGEGYYSSFYGVKEPCDEVAFATNENTITTIITIK
ncbi:alginate lyase family protein [Pedobacter insulae]|uniref:Heparinase II/III N-terminus n=1 Tax=Pedobacter insulae TaxID=414048 RepID=A0A1I2TJR0_9SPHI|nr:alginate lyase family protein [Pedobacter insulae]SFG62736.1 Heparinase II/III N-terminus [Pedobacter insulae]